MNVAGQLQKASTVRIVWLEKDRVSGLWHTVRKLLRMFRNLKEDAMNASTDFDSVRLRHGFDERVLHAIDMQDVALTPAGALMVRKAAKAVMERRLPSLNVDRLSLHNTLALFLDQLFWEEGSGRLLMCAELPGVCYCLPIPAEHWKVLTSGQTTQ